MACFRDPKRGLRDSRPGRGRVASLAASILSKGICSHKRVVLTDNTDAGSGHLAPVSEGVEGQAVRRSLRDSQDAAKDAVAAVMGAPQAGLPPDGAKETAAALSRSAQTGDSQAGLRDAAPISSVSTAGKEQHLLRNAAISMKPAQTGSTQAKGADEKGRLLSKQGQGASMSGEGGQPVVRCSADDAQAPADQASPSCTSVPAGVHERVLPDNSSGNVRSSSSDSALPAASSQTAYNLGNPTAAEDSQIEASNSHAAKEEIAGFGQEQLPQQEKQGGQPLAPKAQEHAPAVVDRSIHMLDQGQATGTPLGLDLCPIYSMAGLCGCWAPISHLVTFPDQTQF